MQWQFWIIQTLNSVAFGGLLFLLSSGFSLIFGLMRIPNLAHGAFFMLGAYFGYSLLQLGLHFWLAAIIGGLGVGLLGILMERFILRPALRQRAGPGAGHARHLVHHRRHLPAGLDRRSDAAAGAAGAAPAAAGRRLRLSDLPAGRARASRWSRRSRSIS